MQPYVFLLDTDSDLNYTYVDKWNIPIVRMPYMLNGVDYLDDSGREGKHAAFYAAMREGACPTTSQLPTAAHIENLEPFFAAGQDILFLTFSNQLSANIHNIFEAREDLLSRYPDREMIVVDSLSVSFPIALLYIEAHALYEQGMPMHELADWLEKNKLRTQAYFVVDDLIYLKRGGRISSTAAAVGSLLDLKPLLTETRDGKLQNIDKIKGHKRALKTLVDKVAENIEDPAACRLVVAHADAPDDAQKLCEMLKERIPDLCEPTVWPVGFVVGAHCGPGTLAVVFIGKERTL